LIAQIVRIGHAMGVITFLPNFSWTILAYGKREPTLDELGAALDRHVWCGREEYVHVVGHHDEGVELEFACVTVAEECGDEEFSKGGVPEDASALVRDGGERVGLWFESHGRACPGG